MSKKNKIILWLLIVSFAVSSYFFIKEVVENKKEENIYDNLQTEIQEPDTSGNNEQAKESYNLNNILKINPDIVAWLKIEGTNINYPVVQNGEYYLRRNIYKQYSRYGTPFLSQFCNLLSDDNLIIFGHNMRNRAMFSQLVNYRNYNFYKNHKYITLYTLENNQTIENRYEIVYIIKTTTHSQEASNFYSNIKFNDEKEFIEYLEICNKLQLYKTNNQLTYGDKLITLVTCEYSQQNGRFIIIAKKVNEVF